MHSRVGIGTGGGVSRIAGMGAAATGFMRTKHLLALLGIFGILSWGLLLVLLAQLERHRGMVNASATNSSYNKRRLQNLALCKESNANGVAISVNALTKLEKELNAGWNQTNRPTRVLTLGTHGYIKRDLPVYESAFTQKTIMVLPKPPDGKLREGKDFDALLCLSFQTDSCIAKEDFRLVGRHRKINRIKSLREVLWSKNTFCDTLSQAVRNFGKSDFFFPCWVLPEQYDQMVADSRRLGITRWISKPRSLGAGMGISIVDDLRELRRHSTHVVQEYMRRPHLLLGADGGKHKWDMRTYVLVTSVVPLRAYVYRRGLVRLATSPYSEDCKSHNQTACLTNTSINKKMEGAKLKDITWSFKKLKDYLTEPVYREMFLKMQRAIGMVLLGALPGFLRQWEGTGDNCEFCYQLLGVDVIFDDELNPKVIECNGEPSMQTTGGGKTHYDVTKKNMIRDLVNLVYQDESGAKESYKALLTKARECATIDPLSRESSSPAPQQKSIKIRKTDASYILDYFREGKAKTEFAPVYPHPSFAGEHREFLQHLSVSSSFSNAIQKQLKSVLLSHDIICEVTLGTHGEGSETSASDDGTPERAASEPKIGKKPSQGSRKQISQPVLEEDFDEDDVDDV